MVRWWGTTWHPLRLAGTWSASMSGLRLFYGCSTVVLIGFTCPAITVATVILRALDRVRAVGGAVGTDDVGLDVGSNDGDPVGREVVGAAVGAADGNVDGAVVGGAFGADDVGDSLGAAVVGVGGNGCQIPVEVLISSAIRMYGCCFFLRLFFGN